MIIVQVSSMFEGREFCVVNGMRDFRKEDIEKRIVEVYAMHTIHHHL